MNEEESYPDYHELFEEQDQGYQEEEKKGWSRALPESVTDSRSNIV